MTLSMPLRIALGEVPAGLLETQTRGEHAPAVQLFDRFVGEVGIDRVRPVADEQAEVHDLPRFAGLDNDADLAALGGADQVMVNRGARQQRRDRRVFGIHAAVGEDQYAGAAVGGLLGFRAQAVERLGESGGALGNAERGRQSPRAQAHSGTQMPQLLEVGVRQDRQRRLDHVRMIGLFVEQVSLRADISHRGHHQLFANRIDGRIGHLRKELLEIAEQQLRAFGKARQGNIDAHRADGLDAGFGHGSQQNALVLQGIAERALAPQQRLEIGFLDGGRRRQIVQMDEMLPQPLRIRLALRNFSLDFRVADDPAFSHIDQKHASGPAGGP